VDRNKSVIEFEEIEAVVVCVNYADYLQHTLPALIQYVDRVAVVTDQDDLDTVELAGRYTQKVTVRQTDEFYRFNGKPCKFNKGAGINIGLDALDKTGWVLHLDADILLTSPIPELPRRRWLYHARRHAVVGMDELNRLYGLIEHEGLQAGEEYGQFPPCKIYTKLPPGYFHLWHYPMHPRPYPEYNAASKSDMWFAGLWPKKHRHVFRNYRVFHLETPGMEKAANWNGRTTPLFGGDTIDDSTTDSTDSVQK